MLNRLLNHLPIYFLPPFLLAMEWLLRQAMGVDSHEFAAPTIAAAGLGLMLPLTVPKDRRPAIGETTQREMKTLTASITSVREQIFISVVWMGILFSIVSWTFCLVKSCKPNALPFGWPHMPVALALYVVSIILSELKESV